MSESVCYQIWRVDVEGSRKALFVDAGPEGIKLQGGNGIVMSVDEAKDLVACLNRALELMSTFVCPCSTKDGGRE